MTETEKLIDEVLKLDAEATKGDWYWYATSPSTRSVLSKVGSRSEIISSGSYNPDAELIAAYRTAAPILAKMLKRAIEQRDREIVERNIAETCEDHDMPHKELRELVEKDKADWNAELDRIVAEGLGEK